MFLVSTYMQNYTTSIVISTENQHQQSPHSLFKTPEKKHTATFPPRKSRNIGVITALVYVNIIYNSIYKLLSG